MISPGIHQVRWVEGGLERAQDVDGIAMFLSKILHLV